MRGVLGLIVLLSHCSLLDDDFFNDNLEHSNSCTLKNNGWFDNIPDISTPGSAGTKVFFGHSDLVQISKSPQLTFVEIYDFTTLDLDGDGHDDFLTEGRSMINGYLRDSELCGRQGVLDADFGIDSYRTPRNIGDWNNNGFDDLALLGNDIRIYAGRSVWVSGFDPQKPNSIIRAAGYENKLLGYIASADVNGDGITDLIASERTYYPSSARLHIFFGVNGHSGTITTADADVVIEDTTSALAYNLVVETGDVNNDGRKDIIVTSPGAHGGGIERGAVLIFFGKSSWPSPLNFSQADIAIGGTKDYDAFGRDVVAGDYTGDGAVELAIRANDANLYLFSGGGNFSSDCASYPCALSSSNADSTLVGGNYYGWCRPGISDLNNDGFAELIVRKQGEGIAKIIAGDATLPTNNGYTNAQVTLSGGCGAIVIR